MKTWQAKRLIDIAEITMGQSPPGESYNSNGDGLPFFQGKAEFGDEHPTKVKWCSQPTRIALAGDILLSVRAPVGPTNIALEKCCIGRGLASIRAKPNIALTRYLLYFFRKFESEIANKGVGSTFTAINKNDIDSLEIPLPPLAEQERIVRLLDEAESLRRLRQQADARMASFIPALFHEMFGDVTTNKMGWEFVSFVDITEGKYGIKAGPFGSSIKKESYRPFGYKVYGQEQVIADDFTIGDYFIDENKFQELKTCEIKPGDILISLVGTIGRISVVPNRIQPGIINPRLLKITPNQKLIIPLFLKTLLQSNPIQNQLNHFAGGMTMGVLNAGILKRLSFTLPPLVLQNEFASRVQEALALRAVQEKSAQRIQALYLSMLSRAFAGEL